MKPAEILSPYPIPPELTGRKVRNLGDGFILRAIEREMGERFGDRVVSPRVPVTNEQFGRFEQASAVVLGGANQLNDNYTLWPGLTAERLRASAIRAVPFAIGIHGEAGRNDAMSESTRDILRVVHERIDYSSWRCPATVSYLERFLPELRGQFLMTGCPVLYGQPVLSGEPFGTDARHVAVTATERGDFWAREQQTIDFVAKQFPRVRKYFVVHQNFSPPGRWEWLAHRGISRPPGNDPAAQLRVYAARRGFRVVIPSTADEAIAFYRGVDIHFGSRLHAHLLLLGNSRRSFLTQVDDRSTAIAAHFGFPLCEPSRLDDHLEMDFEPVRERIIETYNVMRRFVESIKRQ